MNFLGYLLLLILENGLTGLVVNRKLQTIPQSEPTGLYLNRSVRSSGELPLFRLFLYIFSL